jgi:transcriptional regulator GlxA family with amidase domain
MQRAAELLRTTRVGIEQVAQAVGYPSAKTFGRLFKRAFGATPSEFREREERA